MPNQGPASRPDDRQCDRRICAVVVRRGQRSGRARGGGGSLQSKESVAVSVRFSLMLLIAGLAAASPASAQMSVEEARQEGRSLANEKRQDTTLVPTDNARAEAVPGYGGTALDRQSAVKGQSVSARVDLGVRR